MTWLPDLLALVDAIHRRWPDRNHTPTGVDRCTCPHPPRRHDYLACAEPGCGCNGRWRDCACLPCAIRDAATEAARLWPLAAVASHATDPLRSPNLDGVGRSKGTHADTVYVAVLAAVETWTPGSRRPSDVLVTAVARRGVAELALRHALSVEDDQLRKANLREALDALAKIVGAFHTLIPRPPKPQADTGDKGCQSCRRIPGPDGKTPWWNPTEKGQRTLCLACRRWEAAEKADWVKRNGHLPGKPSRLWPPLGALEQYRDKGHMRATETQRQLWYSSDRKRGKGRRAS